jgi:hypothetical protein
MNNENKLDWWDFVEDHYPNYDRATAIANNDDFACLEDGQIDNERREMMFENEYNSDTKSLKFKTDKANSDIHCIERSIEGWIEKNPDTECTIDGIPDGIIEKPWDFVKHRIEGYHGIGITDLSYEADKAVEEATVPTEEQLYTSAKLNLDCYLLAIHNYQHLGSLKTA